MLNPIIESWVHGWDTTPGIVSVWADRAGAALVWRRVNGRLVREAARYRPWLFATHLADLAHLGARLTLNDSTAPIAAMLLDGPAESYRYLITARSGRSLETALLTGASRRLGRPVASLNDLDDYLRLAPVEQYLIATGRVYFRDLSYSDLQRMQIDLETTALDPAEGRIFMAAVRDSHGLERVLEAPTEADEAGLIRDLVRLVRERDPDVIENHNLFGFDLPFLEARAEALGVPLLLARPGAPQRVERYHETLRGGRQRSRYSVAGRELLDTLDAVRRHDFVARDLPSHRLKDVARSFGVAGPERTYLAGAAVYATYRAQPELVRRYALDDVAEVDALSQRLHAAPFALAGMAPRRFERVAWAGPAMGILEPMLLRAYYHAGAAPPLPPAARNEHGGDHAGGALFLFAAGVARHVVKADIASLYPSLMRAHRIGPACDRIGALVGIVEYLLEARLQHKQAARSATPGSLEAGHHHALQAAMKLIINSAYGYMGAVNMALFGDMRAADEVTRRGRETLDQVIAALRRRGVALIEADTDGVYFAVPPAWDEAAERALVAQVAAELPPGIQLEYEGRYAAMFSHEVKNYALLGYDGALTMRGVAMRSVRSEPFAERFLRDAMRCAMQGDSAALHHLLRATVDDLRARRIPLAEVAVRARLTKTPEAYAASRVREGPYEALLAAGRTTWHVGERVRFYRAEGGGYALLAETDEGRQTKDQSLAGVESSSFVLRPSAHPPNYDPDHYIRVLLTNYAGRLRKAFTPGDFAQITRTDGQASLFDAPIDAIQPVWIAPEG
jgi:DNA polymerase elongation subunit (family B)